MNRVLPLILILIALGLFFGYINPTYGGKVQELRRDIQSYDSALKAAEAFREKEAQLLIERNGIPSDGLARVENFLPDGVDNVQLILDLNALASRSGITLSDFDIAEPEEEEGGDALPLRSDGITESLDLSVSGIGSYTAFKTFLEGAEWSLRPLDLVELEIDDSNTGVYNYGMTFRIYWLR